MMKKLLSFSPNLKIRNLWEQGEATVCALKNTILTSFEPNILWDLFDCINYSLTAKYTTEKLIAI